jgi:HAE1 family hydrophobic/amphiphilic exporter-1
MTTTTTVLALLPLSLGRGEGAGLQAALARVVVGGLLASTLVTVFLIPTLYVTATEQAERAQAALRAFAANRRSAHQAEARGA